MQSLMFSILISLLLSVFVLNGQSFDYEKSWAEVNTYELAGLPQSANNVVSTIYNQSQADRNYSEFVKAFIFRLKYRQMTADNAFVTNLYEAERVADSASFPAKPILHSMVGEMYWWYFQNNRYRFYSRSKTVEFEKTDIETWDLNDILENILKHYKLSIAERDKLQKIDINEVKDIVIYDMFLEKNISSSLYDFLILRALELFSNDNFSNSVIQSDFSMNNSDFYLPMESFIQLNIKNNDSLSFQYQSIKLFQELLKLHQKDSKPEMGLIVDMKRLEFVHRYYSNDNNDSLYLNALLVIEKKYSNSEFVPIIGLLIAQQLNDFGQKYNHANSDYYRWDIKKAYDKCMFYSNKSSKYDDAFRKFVSNITQKDIEITIENENIPNQPFRALVRYKNIDSMNITIIKTTYEEYEHLTKIYSDISSKNRPSFNSFLLDTLKYQKASFNYSVCLPNDSDFQKHSAEIKIPSLDAGLYFIIGCTGNDLDYKKHSVSFGLTTITNISFVNRLNTNGKREFYLLNRSTGQPLKNVEVKCFSNHNQVSKLVDTYKSDKNGFFELDNQSNSYYLDFSIKNDRFSTQKISRLYSSKFCFFDYSRSYSYREVHKKTFFFIDRKIYRPGQTVYFKGIIVETDGLKKNNILPNSSSKIEFVDANRQKIKELIVNSNEYGSFSGSFMIPQNGLNGSMSIRNESGNIFFSVEDYKRPKFEVVFDTIHKSYRIGEDVKITGKVIMYSGAKVDGATVNYSVRRETEFNNWYCWWLPKLYSNDSEISNGTVLTKLDGTFEINFIALPDVKIAASLKPVFTYSVNVDVTDITGETQRSKNDVRVGYKSLIVGVEMPETIDKNAEKSFDIITKNLNGNFISATGTIRICRLNSPTKVFRQRRWKQPDRFSMTKEDYYKTFPTDVYEDELNPAAWEIDEKVQEVQFNSQIKKKIEFFNQKNWKTGMYVLNISSKDKFGETVDEKIYFTLYDSKNEKLPYPMDNWVVLQKNVVEPGENAQIIVGSGYNNTIVLVEVEMENKVIEKQWITLDNSQKLFEFPILEKHRGNLAVHITFIQNNRVYINQRNIVVPFTNKKLDIQFESFRNKLSPGEKEQWRLRMKGKSADKLSAEMVATLYDKSLDAFKTNSFYFDLWHSSEYRLNWNSDNCFKINNLTNYTQLQNFQISFPSFRNEQIFVFDWFDFGYHIQKIPPRLSGNSLSLSKYKITESKNIKNETDVTGIVYAENNLALPNVTVVFFDGNDRIITSTITDENGKFSILSKKMPNKISFYSIGYESVEIEGIKNKKLTVEINLIENSSVLGEVRVFNEKQKSFGQSGLELRSFSNDVDGADSPNSVDSEEIINVVGVNTMSSNGGVSNTNLSSIKSRTNFNETAFFYPHLQTDSTGNIIINFTAPESLTRWKMLAFAHTKDLAYGFIENELVTQKSLMITSNAPRFFRESDTIMFAAKIKSLTDKDLSGNAQLLFFDALTMKPIDLQMNNTESQQMFTINKGESANLKWKISIPVGLQAVTYRVVAKAGDFSDGEESSLPVLSNSILVTESMPMSVKGIQKQNFKLDKLVSNTSPTLRNHLLTLEYTSNPAWYAVQALPYLMEYPYECAEQTFSRFYANSLASHIANSNTRIKQVFDAWRNYSPEALLSNLEKNQELKSLLLEETPWVMNAQNESERKKRIALLFELNHMSNELSKAYEKMQKMQTSNGAFPWFTGGQTDRYITQHIVCGMGKLSHLGVKNIRDDRKTWDMVKKAIQYTDSQIANDYAELVKNKGNKNFKISDNHLNNNQIQYLYARSFFNDIEITDSKTKEAFDYYLNQAKTYWLSNNFYMQGMIALALQRYDNKPSSQQIVKSLREHAITSKEMGMYFANNNSGYWYQAPIETQAMMIEAFDEIANDSASVDEMKIWLLKQKQAQNWKTTKATVEATYALLLRGTNWLPEESTPDISVGNIKINPATMPEYKTEAGTGYFKTSWSEADIKPEMGNITINKTNNGISWGALYWQYFEQLDKIKTAQTPLQLKKQLFLEVNSISGKVLRPIYDSTLIAPGDLVKVRIELRVDRDMEYVHMKDMRASCFEPINVFSTYKYQDGLSYYESTRDAATNFFISWLPKGTYVFEYPLRVSHYGSFSNGITTIQSMYAPEFTSHSQGVRVIVKK